MDKDLMISHPTSGYCRNLSFDSIFYLKNTILKDKLWQILHDALNKFEAY